MHAVPLTRVVGPDVLQDMHLASRQPQFISVMDVAMPLGDLADLADLGAGRRA